MLFLNVFLADNSCVGKISISRPKFSFIFSDIKSVNRMKVFALNKRSSRCPLIFVIKVGLATSLNQRPWKALFQKEKIALKE